MRSLRLALIALAATLASVSVASAQGSKPLFADEATIHVTIAGAIPRLVRHAGPGEMSVPATLAVEGEGAAPITLSLRGRTRRLVDACQFPPLRVAFAQRPEGGVFAGQKSLKLVTHCRGQAAFQQYVLLEYAAYHLFNRLTPLGFRVRLAQVDYVDDAGRPIISRLGYFLEEPSDLARRNGLREVKAGPRVAMGQLDPAQAGRVAAFEYLIGNLDWSMTAGPAGTACCHNVKLLGDAGAGGALVPAPYDFDSSGLVDAPYAMPPPGIELPNVRVRRFRGYCRHAEAARAAMGEARERREELLQVLASTPGLDGQTRLKASAYLEEGFRDVSTEAGVARVLKGCIG